MKQTSIPPLEILAALGIHGQPTVSPVRGGFDMAMWKVEYERQCYALRVFGVGRYADCERERVVMAAARAAGLPVPEVYASGVWQDRPALLMTWLTGRTLADELRARPWRIWRLGIEFGRMQAAIHGVPAPELLCQSDSWIGWKCESEETIQDCLRRRVSGEMDLLHLDYHPLNVLTDGRQITGIVDWANAHAGDARADAARTVSILRVDPGARKPLLQWLYLRIFALAWRRGYQRERGRLKDMAPFYAWAGTTIQQDLAYRYQHAPQELAPARRWTNKWKVRVWEALEE